MGSGCCSCSDGPTPRVGGGGGILSSGNEGIWLPYMHKDLMEILGELRDQPPKRMQDLSVFIGRYAKIRGCRGLSQALQEYPEGRVDPVAYFLSKTLPFIVGEAFKLKERVETSCPKGIPLLQAHKQGRCKLPRTVVTSLIAHMFLCTTDCVVATTYRDMPSPASCIKLLNGTTKHEWAKLKMIVHYFERVMEEGELKGHIIVDRVALPGLKEQQWMESKKPLIPVDMAKQGAGFEEAPGLAHVDFANKLLGGGVFTGGCVQEEIRFAICPECLCGLLFCPKMEDEEAIQIVGAEQFSAYTGYGRDGSRGLRYGGDHRDNVYPRDTDGTPLVCILAMDAIDFNHKDSSIKNQMKPQWTVRELNKAYSAFQAVDDDSLKKFPSIATGNWGCGAFKGEPSVKAVIQWAAACACGRQLKYFPFELGWGPILQQFSKEISAKGATVGELMTAYWKVRERIHTFNKKETLFDAIRIVMGEDEEAKKHPKSDDMKVDSVGSKMK